MPEMLSPGTTSRTEESSSDFLTCGNHLTHYLQFFHSGVFPSTMLLCPRDCPFGTIAPALPHGMCTGVGPR
jgi:hypothetical protein